MTPLPRIAVLGAGAAGAAAARTLAAREDLRLTVFTPAGEGPLIRTLLPSVAFGPLAPELVAIGLPQTDIVADAAVRVDRERREIELSSGRTLTADAIVVATGSTARELPPDLPGRDHALASGRLHTLHGIADAVRIRDLLSRHPGGADVALLGGGAIAAETASTLHRAGHRVTLIARSDVPGRAAFGDEIAELLVRVHRERVRTLLGRVLVRLDAGDESVILDLDDGTIVRADLVLAALGSVPSAPSPWTDGVDVDAGLRTPYPGVYAAGGVARHHDDLPGPWRIDHWEESAAQGAHAARAVLADLGRGEDPGPYRPRSPFTAMVHGLAVSGAGLLSSPGTRDAGDAFIIRHLQGRRHIGLGAVDAVGVVFAAAPTLHEEPER